MMGGDVTVTSQLGSGSTFTIRLPAQVDALEAAKAVAAAERVESRAVPEGVHPILVIDDDPNSRDLLQRMLESEGYAVATASNGEEGLELARTVEPSLITLDVLMPGMDGWAVLRELKADPALQHIPVMMVSVTSDMDMGYTLGAVEHLTKPVDRDSLRRLVSQYAAPTGGGHALVVDDDGTIRSLFRRTLEADGWTVAEAANGADALDRVAEQQPRVILLDLMMPVMDGFDFLLRYRSLKGCASTPIIVITAKDLSDEDRQRLNGGVERIIEKGGLTKEQLLAHVRGLMASGKAPKKEGAESVAPGETDSG
jgi:CheY-like chemotaxis protein